MSGEGETFGYLTFPKVKPEKAAGDYLQSKLEDRVLKKYPQWDYPRSEPIVNLVATRRDLHKVELQLEEKKKEAIKQRENLDDQWKKLEEEALKIRQTFCDFDKMVQQNTQKRERATIKTEKNTDLQTERDKAIKELQLEHDKLSKIRDEMENQINKLSMYEEYLQTVAEAHPEYGTPKDVFNKFGALDEARNALTEKMDENLATLENFKDEMVKRLKGVISQKGISPNMKLIKEQNVVLIGMNNRIAELYKRHSAAKANARKWEELVQKIQNESGKKLIDILNVRKACWNIYLEICNRRKLKPQFDQHDFESHLWFIKKTILKLKRTLEIARQRSETDINSVCVERPISKRRV